MQKPSFSSSPTLTTPTPPPPLPPKPPPATKTKQKQQQQLHYHVPHTMSATSSRATPAIIPLDYNYQTMSPSASTDHHHTQLVGIQTPSVALELDNQYSSLFGDPVPPPEPEEYFGSSAFETLRETSVEIMSSEEDAFSVTLDNGRNRRLFPNVPYSSSSHARQSSLATQGTRNFDVLPTPLPRLQPPDIQILPNSSGGSSSEQQNSPNFELLAPEDILTKPDLYEFSEAGDDVNRLEESYTICDAQGRREYKSETETIRRATEDFKREVTMSPCSMSATQGNEQQQQANITRQCSNESYSSAEWFRPATQRFPEFSRIPKLRPSSKNIMSMKRDELPPSPLANMIPDSNGSSSGGEERLMDTTQILSQQTIDTSTPPARPPAPSSASMRAMDRPDLILSPSQYLHRSSIDSYERTTAATPAPTMLSGQDEDHEDRLSIIRELSPAIIKDSIATGGDYRVEQARLHKKTAFTIISDRSPQSSRAHSPSPHRSPTKHPPQSTTSSTSTHTKPLARPRHHLQRKSLTSTQLKLPQISTQFNDDSPRPSVQFNMTSRYSPSKTMPQKGILQQRDSLTSSQDTYTPTPLRRPSTTMKASTLPQVPLPYGQKIKSCEALPLITDPYRTSIPRLHRSSYDLSSVGEIGGPETAVFPPGALPRPLKPNPNPTRKQRGLLRVINHEEILSRIPKHSNWTSMEDLTLEQQRRKSSIDSFNLSSRRRSSSTSPERRSSTQTASDRRSSNLSTITTSDFSFRRPSTTLPSARPANQRRKSLYPTPSPTAKRRQSIFQTDTSRSSPVNRAGRTKISKPTTLSPIIGTPNKDSSTPQSPETLLQPDQLGSDTQSDLTSRRSSISRIPVRHRSDSRTSSQPPSRSSSPLKDFAAQLPLSGRTSRATSSRSPSRATVRSTSDPTSHQQMSTSRANSRAAESRSTSRASTRPLSRGPPSRGPSRASTRSNSRMEQARDVASSRADSRLSVRSSQRSTSVSPATTRGVRSITPNRRKSISLSPQRKQLSPLVRKKSMSPVDKSGRRTTSRGRTSPKRTNFSMERLNSRSRIPTKSSKSSPAKSPPRSAKTKDSKTPNKSMLPIGRASGAKSAGGKLAGGKQPTSAKKTPSSVRKADSSVKRTPSSVGKQAAAAKKQTSNLKRDVPTRQSGGKKSPANGGGKTAKGGKGAEGGGDKAAEVDKKSLARGGSQLSIKKSAGAIGDVKKPETAKAADNQQVSEAEKKESGATGGILPVAEQVSAAVLQAAEVLPAVTSEVTAAAAGAAATPPKPGPKRQGSNMSTLVRMSSRLSLMSTKKRTDSAQSRKVRESAMPVLTDVPDVPHSPMAKVAGEVATPAAAILEKSQKTLETIQKTVTDATDEIHKTINENLTDLKTLESDMGLTSDSATSPATSVATVIAAKPGESVSRTGTADGSTGLKAANDGVQQKSPVPPSQPIEASVSVLNASSNETAERVSERAISVLPEVDCESANLQNYEFDVDTTGAGGDGAAKSNDAPPNNDASALHTNAHGVDAKRRSPDGQGGSTAGSGKTGSQEFLEPKDADLNDSTPDKGCCRCCTKLCMPCRRSRCSRCCTRRTKTAKDEEQPVLSATSSATTATNVEVIDEKKTSCWQKLNCCRSCGRQKKKDLAMESGETETLSAKSQTKMETIREEASPPGMTTTTTTMGPPKQSKCGLCLSKIFCCRSVNKIDPTTGDETEVKKCCFCIPCRRKRGHHHGLAAGSVSPAWQDPERGITATDASVVEGGLEPSATAVPKEGCCTRFWGKLLCCRKKQRRASDARRQSIRAPPTTEDTRRKLHVDLVEYSSQMKGAIPVLPLYLAWFCAICNVIFPGLGTLLSGLFCLCVGIPRFSHYDSARARIGSFIINIIVGVSQFFCVLFCFVGWGWSIWWATIMIRCAKKLSKIKKVERLELEEEQRQAEAAEAAAAAAAQAAAAARNAPPAYVAEPETAKT